jgi:hypothetical protein
MPEAAPVAALWLVMLALVLLAIHTAKRPIGRHHTR